MSLMWHLFLNYMSLIVCLSIAQLFKIQFLKWKTHKYKAKILTTQILELQL
jgi:hypothetical protein